MCTGKSRCKSLCKSVTPPMWTPPMHAETQPVSRDDLLFQLLPPSELAKSTQSNLSWLWHGYLASGKMTALISPPKSGKTTLASHLLARFAQGGPLAGLAVAPGRAVVISEESVSDWDGRCRRLALGPNVQF